MLTVVAFGELVSQHAVAISISSNVKLGIANDPCLLFQLSHVLMTLTSGSQGLKGLWFCSSSLCIGTLTCSFRLNAASQSAALEIW